MKEQSNRDRQYEYSAMICFIGMVIFAVTIFAAALISLL